MKPIRHLLIALVLCICLTGLCAAASATTTTVMIYMCGTDIQEDAVTDLGEITGAATGSDVKVIVLAGGAKKWDDGRLTRSKANLFTISNGKWSKVTNWGSLSMGDPDTLKRFVTYCWNNCHSDRNMLVMWDHGSSAVAGMCFDEVHNDDSLLLGELEDVFSQLSASLSGFHLDIIGADACLMGSYEMAVTLAPYADYYVGSEELEPYLGWYYVNWLKGLCANPSISTRDLAASIVDSYRYGCERDDPNDYLTLSAIDLSAMDELAECVNSLAATLTSRLSGSSLSAICRALQSCYVFGTYDDAGSDMIDLTDFISVASAYDASTAAAATAALKKAVVKSYANSYVPAAEGLSIFVPMQNAGEISYYIKDYSTDALAGYAGFVRAFASATGSSAWSFSSGSSSSPSTVGEDDSSFQSSLEDYSSSSSSEAGTASAPNGQYAYSITLSDEDMHYLSSADLMLFQDFSDENGYDLDLLGCVRNTWIDWDNNTVYAVFDGTWTFLGDSLVVMYEQSRTDYGRRCIVPVVLNGSTRTYLVVEYRTGEDEGTILGTSAGWTENGLPVRGVTPLENGDTITPVYPSYTSSDTSAEPDLNTMECSTATYADDPSFVTVWDGTQTITQGFLTEGSYKLAFRLYDIFGGQTDSGYISFELNEDGTVTDETGAVMAVAGETESVETESVDSGEASFSGGTTYSLDGTGLTVTFPADFEEDEISRSDAREGMVAGLYNSELYCAIYMEDADGYTAEEIIGDYLGEINPIDYDYSFRCGAADFGRIVYTDTDSGVKYTCAMYVTVSGDTMVTFFFTAEDSRALTLANQIMNTVAVE